MTVPDALRARVSSESGLALPLALLVLLMVSVMGFAVMGVGMTDVSIATNWRAYNTAFYAADAGVQKGLVNLRDLLTQNPNATPSNLALIQTAPNVSDKTLTFAVYCVNYANNTCPQDPTQPAPNPYRTTFTSGQFSGLFGLVTDYRITSQVTGAGGTKATVTQIFKYVGVPLFQFGIFYGKGVDLELRPGPSMTFNGKIFANSNIYIQGSSNAGATLQLTQSMKTSGNIYRGIKADPSDQHGNNPQIADANGTLQTLDFDHTYKPGFSTKWASASDWANAVGSKFGGQVQDSANGVGQIIPPVPELFTDPSNPDVVAHRLIEMPKPGVDSPGLTKAKLYSQAGLRIIDGVATDQNGKSVPLPPDAVTTKSFYDAREQKTVNVYEIDVDKLNPAKPGNGIVYVASTATPTATTMPGVRLVNGGKLPQDGLTVVSQNPVYVKGDYNKDSWGKKDEQGKDTVPPAAIMADAVTVLSGNWDDSKGAMTYNNRGANATIVNAAIATGPSSESKLGSDNGKANNLVRFLEDWTGKKFEYKGSLVSLWHSQQATGKWRCCGSGSSYYYAPPDRVWSYDTMFDTNPPPGTPSGTIMIKSSWSQS